MARIRYTKTYFREPGSISEDLYQAFKVSVRNNPNFEIDPVPETFSQHFDGLLKTIGIAFFVALFCFGIFEDGSPMIAIGGFAMVACIFSIIYLFLEGPSYATYIKRKKEYFSR